MLLYMMMSHVRHADVIIIWVSHMGRVNPRAGFNNYAANNRKNGGPLILLPNTCNMCLTVNFNIFLLKKFYLF